MAAQQDDAAPQSSSDISEALAAARRGKEAADAQCQAEIQRIATEYGLTEAEAAQCLFAFDDLLHLDRHTHGIEQLVALGSKAGRYLLDQLKACSPDEGETRPHFITQALCQCLSGEVEAELVAILTDRSMAVSLRPFAIVALAQGKEDSSRQALVEMFQGTMQRERDLREPMTFRALVLAMEAIADPKAVAGLTRVIAEERRSSSVDCVVSAVRALGDIGDPRATPVLKKLAENRKRWQLAPQACLALAKLKFDKAPDLARAARARTQLWTAWQLEVFEEVEKLCKPKDEEDKKDKDEKKDSEKEESDA